MTKNFKFCNEDMLPLFVYKPFMYYNQFYNEEYIINLVKSIGDYPDFKIEFRYDESKRIRAIFIIFEDAIEDLDVKCISVVFNGSRQEYYCNFYELYEDGTIGWVEVANYSSTNRVVKALNVGFDIDRYFEEICSCLKTHEDSFKAVIYYREDDRAYRILDFALEEMSMRCHPLLNGEPDKSSIAIQGVEFLLFKSKENGSYIAFRGRDEEHLENIKLSDIELLKLYK